MTCGRLTGQRQFTGVSLTAGQPRTPIKQSKTPTCHPLSLHRLTFGTPWHAGMVGWPQAIGQRNRDAHALPRASKHSTPLRAQPNPRLPCCVVLGDHESWAWHHQGGRSFPASQAGTPEPLDPRRVGFCHASAPGKRSEAHQSGGRGCAAQGGYGQKRRTQDSEEA